MLRSFARKKILAEKYRRPDNGCANADNNGAVEGQTLVPWMSLYNNIDIDSGSEPLSIVAFMHKISRALDGESQASGDEEHMSSDS